MRDEGYDPHLFQTIKLGMQRSLIIETLWLLLVIAMTISIAVSSEQQPSVKYWGFMGQYLACIVLFYAFSVQLLVGFYKRPLRSSMRMKNIDKVIRPVVYLVDAICMVFAYDAFNFY